MDVEATTIREFLVDFFEDQRVKLLIQDWRVDPMEIIPIIESEMVEMGIYAVPPLQFARTLKEEVLWRLRHSPGVRALLARLAREEQLRASRRR